MVKRMNTNLSRKELYGYYFQQEKWTDNTECYRKVLKGHLPAPIEQKHAREMLELNERFPPSVPHDRMVGHLVKAYLIKNPMWEKRKGRKIHSGAYMTINRRNSIWEDVHPPMWEQLVVARNIYEDDSLEKVLEIDIGQEIKRRFEAGEIQANEGTLPNSFLDISYDLSYFDKIGSFSYKFSINTEIENSQSPIKFHLTHYVDIDGVRTSEEQGVFRPAFNTGYRGDPLSFKKLMFTRR